MSNQKSRDAILENAKVKVAKVTHIKDLFPNVKAIQSPIAEKARMQSSTHLDRASQYQTTTFNHEDAFVMQEKFYKHLSELQSSLKFLLASARTEIYSDPAKTKVCIATNGGVVPGMTAVIKAITKCLEQEYNVKEIYGVKWGFKGLMEDKNDDYIMKLTAENMADTHSQGGTILGTSRDEFDLHKVIASLKRHKFTQIYMIGSIET